MNFKVMASPANVRLEGYTADLKERVHVLKTFNARDEVNHYCDLIEANLNETHQSQVKHLTDLLTKSLGKVHDYRKKLLDRVPSGESRTDDQDHSRLIAEVDSFLHAIGEVQPTNESIPDQPIHDHPLKDSIRDVQLFNLKIKRALSEARRAAFNGSFLNLKPNDTFKQQDDLLGLLVESEWENIPGNLEMIHENTLVDTPLINSIILLDDGRVVTGTNEEIKLWKDDSLQNNCGISSPAISLLRLSDNQFVCALLSGQIQLLEVKKDVLRTISIVKIHRGIFNMRTYYDQVISFSASDGFIKVWGPERTFYSPKCEIFVESLGFALDAFPDSFLVTASCAVESSIQVWSSVTAASLLSINFSSMKFVKSLLALSNCYTIMVSSDSETQVLDLISESVIRKVSHQNSLLTGQLTRLMHGYGLACFLSSRDASIKFFYLQTGQIIDEISLNQSNTALCLSVARDNQTLVLAMADGTVNIYKLKFT